MARKRLTWMCGCFLACVGGVCGLLAGGGISAAVAGTPPAISVVGNQLESGGAAVQLRGVNRGAYETCSGHAVYDNAFPTDPNDDFADGPVNLWSTQVMESWGINTVRIPLNESCWLGTGAGSSSPTGPAAWPDQCESQNTTDCETAAGYRQNVEDYVNLLSQNGFYVVLDLQFTAPQGYDASQQDYFPDAAHAPAFWSSLAATFAGDPNVLFDVLGEFAASPSTGPTYLAGSYHETMANAGEVWSTNDIWNCWLNGCPKVPSAYGGTYTTVGVQSLIDTIRGSGATNPIIVASPDYSLGYDETGCTGTGSNCWQDDTPTDPENQLVVDAHLYDFDFPAVPDGGADSPSEAAEQTAARQADSYIDQYLVPVAAEHPVMLGELGESDCNNADGSAPFVNAVLTHLDSLADGSGPTISVLGWTWDTDDDEGNPVQSGWTCPAVPYGEGGPELITDYDGTPTSMGQAFETWMQAKEDNPPEAPPSAITTTASTSAPTTPAAAPAGTPEPTAKAAPRVIVSSSELVCVGATFTNASDPTASYAFYDTADGRRIAGPQRSDALALETAYTRPIDCSESVTTTGGSATSAASASLPVPGRVSFRGAGPVKLVAICPRAGHHSCRVALSLVLAGRHAEELGAATLSLRAGRDGDASVDLSAAARRLLAHDRSLSVTLTVRETIGHLTQTVAKQTLALKTT